MKRKIKKSTLKKIDEMIDNFIHNRGYEYEIIDLTDSRYKTMGIHEAVWCQNKYKNRTWTKLKKH